MEEYIKIVENARDEFERKSKFLKEENTEIRKYQYEQDFLQQQLDQLKQTLTEIKEIAEKAKKDICNNCAWRNTDSCDPEYYTCGELIKILQKIKEVV